MNHIKTIDDGLVPLYQVKSPYTAVKSGYYGFQGVLLYDKALDEVQCHICGGMYTRLAPHVLAQHNMRSQEYKKEFGFSKKTALMGEDERKAHIESMVLRVKNGEVMTLDKQVQKYNPRSKGQTWKDNMEYKNNRDMCPEQMIKRVKVLVAMMGRTPTAREFGHQGSVKSSFNTYSQLLMQAELQSKPKAKFPTKWSHETLIKTLQDFRKDHGRDPMTSDTTRGLLPAANNFRYWFGTWGEAKLAAGFKLVKNQYSR